MGNYYVKPRIYMEREGLREILKGVTRAFIVTDKFMHESGKVSYLTDVLDQMGIAYEIFSEVKPDPDIATVTKGIGLMTDFKPQALLALGGGSPIDCAKAINYLSAREGFSEKCKFVAIPTTSGTGTEVSRFSVISDPEKSAKYPLVADELLPDDAILDAELVRSVPPAITADTGMDVLTHAIESYVSINHNEFTSALAEKSIEICGVYLYRAYVDGNDMHARQKMHVASCLAGLSFNAAGLGITHSMAHQLGAIFHIPHGRANAMLLPHIVEYNANINKRSRSQKEYLPAVKRYSNIAHLLGLSNYNEVMSVRSLVNWIQFMQKEMNIPLTIEEMKTITPDAYFAAVDKMADMALADACTAANPRVPKKEDIIKIYTKLWSF